MTRCLLEMLEVTQIWIYHAHPAFSRPLKMARAPPRIMSRMVQSLVLWLASFSLYYILLSGHQWQVLGIKEVRHLRLHKFITITYIFILVWPIVAHTTICKVHVTTVIISIPRFPWEHPSSKNSVYSLKSVPFYNLNENIAAPFHPSPPHCYHQFPTMVCLRKISQAMACWIATS